MHNKVIAFVKENNLYVTPHTEDTVNLLHRELFEKKAFFVPFSDEDYAEDIAVRDKWYNIMNTAAI